MDAVIRVSDRLDSWTRNVLEVLVSSLDFCSSLVYSVWFGCVSFSI